jgi:isoaspartyl peptidase/L-asparaginase-like protein (Ntn-hydrolase superfamily)
MANALNGPSALGREPPLVVVGDGARTFAASMGLETATSESELQQYQVTDAATRQWCKWHARVQGETEPKTPEEEEENDRMDTVGVVCVDPRGNVAAALSSGGVLYKVPGRVGLAGCPRVGADARNAVVSNSPEDSGLRSDRKRPRQRQRRNGFAVACTGRGEQFIRSAFVQALTERLVGDAIAMDEALRYTHAFMHLDDGGKVQTD